MRLKLWEEIELAQNRVRKIILRTPMLYSDAISKLTGKEVYLKREGSFVLESF